MKFLSLLFVGFFAVSAQAQSQGPFKKSGDTWSTASLLVNEAGRSLEGIESLHKEKKAERAICTELGSIVANITGAQSTVVLLTPGFSPRNNLEHSEFNIKLNALLVALLPVRNDFCLAGKGSLKEVVEVVTRARPVIPELLNVLERISPKY